MYEENTNKEQNMNSDEHNNSNMGTPDFTMKDPEPVQNQQQGQASTGAQTQGSYNWQNQQTSGNPAGTVPEWPVCTEPAGTVPE